MKRLINCTNASFGYEGKIVAENINFEIFEGDYIFVVGENGSGKSTLIKGILSLIKPYNGKIELENSLTQSDIGYFPQHTELKNDFPASVEEIVLSGCMSNSAGKFFYNRKDKALAEEKMKILDVFDIRKKAFSSLSGGQRQRVLLSRALCATKKMIILDEPVANLDPLVTREFYDIINKINKEMNITVLMVSHDMNSTVKYAKKILHIGENENFFGDLDDYLSKGPGKNFLGGKRL